MGRSAKRLFKSVCTDERGRTVVLVLLEHVFGDVYPAVLGVQLLYTALTRENVCQVVDTQRLLRGRMDGRHGFVGHICLNVVPLCGDFALLEDEFFLFAHTFIDIGLVFALQR